MSVMIPKGFPTRHPKRREACAWCSKRSYRISAFCLIEGPLRRYYCDTECGDLWVKWRHVRPVYDILQLAAADRAAALEKAGVTTLDELISQHEASECAVTSSSL